MTSFPPHTLLARRTCDFLNEESSTLLLTRRKKERKHRVVGVAMASLAATTTAVSEIRSFSYVLPKTLTRSQPNKVNFKLSSARHQYNRTRNGNMIASATASGSPGLYSSEQFELTRDNVDMVLEDVRPYLIADGGNVDVVSVENGVVSLKLQGACGSCPSSTTTMKMGIERVLKEKFGDAVKDIYQVLDDHIHISETTLEAINAHLDILRPAIKNYGGSVQVLSVEAGDCLVQYVGPESIGSGIKAAIKEKFPDIVNVVLTD